MSRRRSSASSESLGSRRGPRGVVSRRRVLQHDGSHVWPREGNLEFGPSGPELEHPGSFGADGERSRPCTQTFVCSSFDFITNGGELPSLDFLEKGANHIPAALIPPPSGLEAKWRSRRGGKEPTRQASTNARDKISGPGEGHGWIARRENPLSQKGSGTGNKLK